MCAQFLDYLNKQHPQIKFTVEMESDCVLPFRTMISALRQQLDNGAEGLLLVDASNAFNTLNRRVMLHNVSILCPSFAPCVVNYYRSNAQLFTSGEVIESMEGTTQGDPLSMAIYALATLPLIVRAQESITAAIQSWFADDAGAARRLWCLFSWCTKLAAEGPQFGYNVNPPKTWLVVRDEHLQAAHDLFGLAGINITTEGRPVLGAPCGEEEYCRSFCSSSVMPWVSKVTKLAKFAKTQPHAAFAAFTHGLSSEWTYMSRSVPSLEDHLQPLEDVNRRDFLPSLTGRAASDLERNLLSLPARSVLAEWPWGTHFRKHVPTMTRPLRS